MKRFRWKIFWANLNPIKGSEQAGIRPVLVVSADEVNDALPIVGVLPLTSYKPGCNIYPTEVYLPGLKTGLPHDSIAMAHQVRVIAKERLSDECGQVVEEKLQFQIKKAMRTYLDL